MSVSLAYKEDQTSSDISDMIVPFRVFDPTSKDFGFPTDVSTYSVSVFKPGERKVTSLASHELMERKLIGDAIHGVNSLIEIGNILFKDGRGSTKDEIEAMRLYIAEKFKKVK